MAAGPTTRVFERNVGGLDRRLRLAGGLVLLAAGVGLMAIDAAPSGYAAPALVGSAGLLFNALTGWCLLNRLLGIDTCSRSGE